MAYDGNDPTGLVGEQLNTVAFVMDYVEFKFNGPVLRALTNPIIEGDGLRLRFPEPGSRDALCSLIGSEVAAVTIKEGDRIEVALNSDRKVTIPLDRDLPEVLRRMLFGRSRSWLMRLSDEESSLPSRSWRLRVRTSAMPHRTSVTVCWPCCSGKEQARSSRSIGTDA
jgi:hypothetical protein